MLYLRQLLNEIKQGNIKTAYSHQTLIDEARGILEADCSALAEYWLQQAHPRALAEIYAYINQVRDVKKYRIERLYSFDFYDFFCELSKTGSSSWDVVNWQQRLQAGDLLALVNRSPQHRWGHIAIITDELARTENMLRLRVIDSSRTQHFDDWRQSVKMGIGEGVIELYFTGNELQNVCYAKECIKPRAAQIGRLKGLK
ncbi:MAG: hypothetical protein IJ184_03175 [Alphaproteobacteria bacterium]|nr:hypothetical protein [Alphaproteobacteria bacterium]